MLQIDVQVALGIDSCLSLPSLDSNCRSTSTSSEGGGGERGKASMRKETERCDMERRRAVCREYKEKTSTSGGVLNGCVPAPKEALSIGGENATNTYLGEVANKSCCCCVFLKETWGTNTETKASESKEQSGDVRMRLLSAKCNVNGKEGEEESAG